MQSFKLQHANQEPTGHLKLLSRFPAPFLAPLPGPLLSFAPQLSSRLRRWLRVAVDMALRRAGRH